MIFLLDTQWITMATPVSTLRWDTTAHCSEITVETEAHIFNLSFREVGIWPLQM